MARQFKLTTAWDLDLSAYNLQMVDNVDALVQKLKSRLLTFYGEWYQNVTLGVDYFTYILVKNPDLATIERVLTAVILETTGVNKILSFSLNFSRDSRNLDVTFSVDTIYGITPVEATL